MTGRMPWVAVRRREGIAAADRCHVCNGYGLQVFVAVLHGAWVNTSTAVCRACAGTGRRGVVL